MKFQLTANGDLMLTYNKFNETSNFTGNKDDLIQYLNFRIEAMEKHISFLESECNALYSQIPNT